MGENEMIISAIKDGKDQVYSLEINISDHINLNNIEENIQSNSYDKIYQNLDSLLLLIQENITSVIIGEDAKKKEEKKR